MKIFLTEFRVGASIYEGPNIVAESFEEAEEQAEVFNVIVIGILDTDFEITDVEKWKPTLH
tara:strand:- start:500 stop:682 length:183 start_codon:yes stop_codon:yes gene_type:complete